jgi:hypothetical protein
VAVRVRLDRGAVQSRFMPVQVPGGLLLPLQPLQYAFPDALRAPSSEPGVAALPGAVTLGQVSPGCSGPEHPQHAVDDLSVVPILPAWFCRLLRGQQGFLARPFFVRQVASRHANPYLRNTSTDGLREPSNTL